MATSFAAYASQYLTRHGTDTVDSEQPLFFSFTTDDGSRHAHQTDVEDLDDPHLNPSGHDEDPYLKLEDSPPGWLAHLAHSPRRSRSRSRSSSRPASPRSQSSSDNAPPPELLAAPPRRPNPKSNVVRPPPSIPVSELTESLLPREGADVFSLPDPRHIPRKRRKHHDPLWTALWLGAVSLSLLLCIILLFTTKRPRDFPAALLPYAVLLRTVPVLTLLTLFSAAAAYAHVYLLRVFAGPVMLVTSVFVPATLFVSAIWAFVGSFMWDADVEPTWGETVGLRLFAIVPLVLSLITARRLLHLPRHIHRTSSTLTLATHLLVNNPLLAALSPALLIVMLLASLPFLTAVFRLLLIGYATKGPGKGASGWEWHVRAWANWGIAVVLAVWFWSWAVARGILRMTAAGVVGAWYFADPTQPPPPPASTHTIHAALIRSTGPSLGTLTLSALLLTVLRLCTLLLLLLNRLPPLLLAIPFSSYSIPGTPYGLGALGIGVARWIVPGIGWIVNWVRQWEERVSRYVLVYCGMVGVGFWEGAGRSGALVSGRALAERAEREAYIEGNGRNPGRTQRPGRRGAVEARKLDFGSEPSLDLLTISPLTLTLPFSLLTYLFVAHTLGAPHEALGVALLAGATTAVVGVFCVGVVRDCADTLYLCYCIDKAAGERHREEVFIAFEYDGAAGGAEPGFGIGAGLPGSVVLPMHRQHGERGGGSVLQQQQNPRHGRSGTGGMRAGPETIVPRSPLGTGNGGGGGGRKGKRKETLFDALAEAQEDLDESDTEADGRTLRGRGNGRRHPNAQQQKQRRKEGYYPQQAALRTPLASYLNSENESIDGDERTPTMPRPNGQGQPSVPPDDEDDDELNPFRRSAIDDEEAVIGHVRTNSAAGAAGNTFPFATISRSPGTSPLGTSPLGAGVGKVGFGFVNPGHIRSPSGAAGAPRPGERMLSSTQELNMKSQFLMNMRAFGAESQASAASAASGGASGGEGSQSAFGVESHMTAGQGREDEKEEGEESLLGPGSGFFN